MALSIKDAETDALVRKLAQQRRLSFTHAIRVAVTNELGRGAPERDGRKRRIEAAIDDAQRWYRAAPADLSRSEDDILGYPSA